MSAENVKLVEQLYSAMQQRDFSMIPKLFDPEVEISQTEALPWGGRYRGHDGLMQFFGRLLQNIDTKIETERLIDAGDTIVQVGHTRGTALQSGRPFDIAEVHIWKIRDGRVISFQAYIETSKMLAVLSGN